MDTIALIVLTPLPVMLAATWPLTSRPGARRWPRAALALWLLPALGYLGWALMFFRDVIRDPTSHNLWPLEMGMVVFCWVMYVTALRLVFWIAARWPARPDAT
jgi:hypothetical protein